MGDHHAYGATLLALATDGMRRRVGLAPVQVSAEHFHELQFVNGTTAEFEVDKDVIGDGCGLLQRLDVVGPGVNDGNELFHVLEVTQRLNAAGGGASADADEEFRGATNAVDALGVVRRGDGALDQGNIVGALDYSAGSFGKVGDFNGVGDSKQFVFAVEEAELASVAGGELPDGELGLTLGHVRPP